MARIPAQRQHGHGGIVVVQHFVLRRVANQLRHRRSDRGGRFGYDRALRRGRQRNAQALLQAFQSIPRKSTSLQSSAIMLATVASYFCSPTPSGAPLDLTLLQVLTRRTAAGFPRKPAREGVLRMIRPKTACVRLDPLSYESLHQQIVRRDGWRCQSCGTMSNLEVHHREFRSHSGSDSEENLITLCTACHARVHRR